MQFLPQSSGVLAHPIRVRPIRRRSIQVLGAAGLCPVLWVGLLAVGGCAGPAPAPAHDEHRPMAIERLEPYECGSIARVHTLGGVIIASQPSAEDFALAQMKGVRTVIDLRHAHEIPNFDERRVVEGLGLAYVNLPWYGPDELTDEIFDGARALLQSVERPILLHCSSANRAAAVWIPWRVLDGGLSLDEALAEARTIGLQTPAFEEKARAYIGRQQRDKG